MPIAIASAFNAASSSMTPYLRMGSDSPRKAAPNACAASSGEVLANDARSDANAVRSVENVPRSSPVSPAALPNTPNVEAAVSAAVFD